MKKCDKPIRSLTLAALNALLFEHCSVQSRDREEAEWDRLQLLVALPRYGTRE